MRVRLIEIDEAVLERLVSAAVSDAAADEVSAPVTPGTNWTPERIEWVREMHREARAGLSGPAAQATWAVLADDDVAGSVRLRRVDGAESAVETGIWLTRWARGRGIGRQAIELVLEEARVAGISEVRAETTSGNAAAQALLRRTGFAVVARDAGRVLATTDPLTAPR